MSNFTNMTDIECELVEEKEDLFSEEIELRAEAYTTATGCYCEWNIDLDLGPPDKSIPIPPEDENIYTYYSALQYSLYENNLPETEDRSNTPQTQYGKNHISIALLSSPVECMAMLLEGSRTCPGNMLLVLSPTWLSIGEPTADGKGRPMFCRKAIMFDCGGRSFLDVYDPPRRVTYFVNYFTRGCTDGQRSDGESLEQDLDCPMSSSLELVKMVDDKLWTRIIMAERSVHYPETLAFAYQSKLNYIIPEGAKITHVKLDSKIGVDNVIEEEVFRFLEKDVPPNSKVVVKPSGTIWHGSYGVSYHDADHPEDVLNAVLNLLNGIEPENCIMVETFYSCENVKDNKQSDVSFRLRTTVCRCRHDVAVATTSICGIGDKFKPINGDNTVPQSLTSTLKQFGFSISDRLSIQRDVSMASERIMNGIINKEKTMTTKEKGGIGAQTDCIGIDFVLGDQGGVVAPYGIEVNSHDCTINCQLYEFMNPELGGQSVKPWIETMVQRSQIFLMNGKNILVISAGGYSKRFIWKDAKAYGIRIILVDDDPECYAGKNVEQFIQYGFSDHRHDELHARNILHILEKENLVVDGCVTFWEDCVPLAASICSKLRLHGPGLTAARTAKNKTLTHRLLMTRDEDIPHFPRTYLYAAKTIHIKKASDIAPALQEVGTPAVLKLEYGSSAVGVKLVHDAKEAVEEYENLKSKLQGEEDHPGIGLGHGNTFLIMEFIDGTEHDIDIVIFKRQLIAAFVSDNGPTRLPLFTETAASMPTCLLSDKKAQLVTAAYKCCNDIGLVNGVFNVEMKMTRTGPKLIEINARMGGFYLRDWIKACYGVDILFCSFMIACGIRPILPRILKPRGHLMGIMCVPSVHAAPLTMPEIASKLSELRNKGEIRYNPIEQNLDHTDIETEEPYCNIAVMEADLDKAKNKLLDICDELCLSTPNYQVSNFVSDFQDDS